MLCSSCGNHVDPNRRVCTHCGNRLEAVPEPPSALLSRAVTLTAWHDVMLSPPHHRIYGREAETEQMIEDLAQGFTVLLSGPAGTGKTTLALEAAHRLRSDKQACRGGVVWLANIDGAPLAAICDAVSRALGNEEIPRQAPEKKPDLILNMLADWNLLIVLHNIAEPDTVGEFLYYCLPPLTPALVTSNQPLDSHRWSFFLGDSYSTITLDGLGLEGGTALFQERSGFIGEDELTIEIWRLLKGHPLALVLAAVSVRGSADRLAEMPGRLAQAKAGLGPLAEEQIALAPLSCLYREMEEEQRDGFRWLVASFGDSMGQDLLSEVSGLTLSTCQTRIDELASLGLLIPRGDRATLTPAVRDLAHAFLGDELKPLQEEVLAGVLRYVSARTEHTASNREQLVAELDTLLGGLRYAMGDQKWDGALGLADTLCWVLETSGYWTELVAVTLLGIQAAERLGNLEAVGRLARAAADIYSRQGNPLEARRLLDRSLEASEKIGDEASVAAISRQIGSIAQAQGDYAGSRDYLARGLKASMAMDDRVSMADNLFQMGIAAHQQREYEQAEDYYRQALGIRREHLGPDHPKLAEVLNNLALLHQEKGEYAAAQELYDEALQITQAGAGEDSSEVAGILHNLAGLCRATGRYSEAEALYHQALTIRSKALQPDDPAVAQTLTDLAGLYMMLGKYADAVKVQQQAVEIARTNVGEQHPRFAATVRNLAGFYYLAGDLGTSKRLYEQVLDLQRATLGPKHPDVAETMNNLALVYQASGAYDEAESRYREALELCQMTPRGDHPVNATILGNLAGILEATGRYDDAESRYRQALQIRRSAFGEEHPDVAQTLHRLGVLYELMADPVKAESCYREAVEIYRHTLGQGHPDAAATALSLAELYFAAQKYSEAEPFYRQVLDYYDAAGGRDQQQALVLYSLGVIAREKGALSEAEELFQSSLEIKQELDDQRGAASTYAQLGQTARKAGQMDQACAYYEKGLKISRSTADRPAMARTLNQLGMVAQAEGESTKARKYYKQSLAIYQELNMRSDIASTLRQLSLLARKTGETEQAESLVEQSEVITKGLDWLELLRRHLARKATENDLRLIAEECGMDYDNLYGKGTAAKAEELVTAAYLRDKVRELVQVARDKCPDLPSSPELDAW